MRACPLHCPFALGDLVGVARCHALSRSLVTTNDLSSWLGRADCVAAGEWLVVGVGCVDWRGVAWARPLHCPFMLRSPLAATPCSSLCLHRNVAAKRWRAACPLGGGR